MKIISRRLLAASTLGATACVIVAALAIAKDLPLAPNSLYLPSQADTALIGPPDAGAGTAVAGIGDFNGDQRPDIAVGAPLANLHGRHAGAVYIAFSPRRRKLELRKLDSKAGVVIEGYGRDAFTGTTVAAAGDVNHDGLSDVLVGAPAVPAGGGHTHGVAFVVYGMREPHPVDLQSLTETDGFAIEGASTAKKSDGGDEFARTLAGVGDVNGDGFDDVAIGADFADRRDTFGFQAGTTYVMFGGPHPGNLNVGSLPFGDQPPSDRGFLIEGTADLEHSGAAVAGAGDVNGDGMPDIVIGATGAQRPGSRTHERPGGAYVVYGSHDAHYVDLAKLDDTGAGFAIIGPDVTGLGIGASVAGAGAMNRDQLADIVIGAPDAGKAKKGAPPPGETYVIYGRTTRSTVDLSALTSRRGYVIRGLSQALAGPGDANGDGRADLLLGDPGFATLLYGADRTGSVKALAPATEDGFTLAGRAGSRTDVANPGDLAGTSLSGAGDLNGDGVADLVVGAPGGGHFDGMTGAYVVYGARDEKPTVRQARFRPRRFAPAPEGSTRVRDGGSRVSYVLSQAAIVKVKIRAKGSKRTLLTITQLARGARNSFYFDGRAGDARLPRGRYVASFSALTRTERVGGPVTARFAIVKKRK